MTPEDRFWEKASLDLNGCWTWHGAKTAGYGIFWHDGRLGRAHRWLFTQLRGPIATGLQLDHLCRNRSCVNPWHLEAVTQQENIRRGQGHGSETHCPHGHPYSPENTYRAARGDRQCRTCKRARDTSSRLAARAHHPSTQPNPRGATRP